MREYILLYLDKCRVRRLIRFQGLSAVPLAVALVVWFILYAVYRKWGGAAGEAVERNGAGRCRIIAR